MDARLTAVASRLECNSRYLIIISSVKLPDISGKISTANVHTVLYMPYLRRLHSKSTLENGLAVQDAVRKVGAA